MNEGPSHEPPALPAGWIAQWDAESGKYYFVELSTRQTRWDVPTASSSSTPYEERSNSGLGQQQQPGEGERGVGGDGPEGERGLGVCIPWFLDGEQQAVREELIHCRAWP